VMVASAKVGCGRNHDDSPASWVGRLLLSAYDATFQDAGGRPKLSDGDSSGGLSEHSTNQE
ncbi:hypothetical protein, partial [Ralstonia pseudosolanacearum]|uniref:hypothetical protein n=1 Tax=Ralstonia pseudosolanacearum TaxID=1310165 RepID=UPI001FF73DD5